MAHAPTREHRAPAPPEDRRPGLRDVPGLSLRAGRHLTAWLLWHTARVSLVADAPPPGELDRAARV